MLKSCFKISLGISVLGVTTCRLCKYFQKVCLAQNQWEFYAARNNCGLKPSFATPIKIMGGHFDRFPGLSASMTHNHQPLDAIEATHRE